MQYRGKKFKHRYETFLPEELFTQTQEKLQKRGKLRQQIKTHTFKYRDTFICEECNHTIRAYLTKTQIYYKCANHERPHFATALQEKTITELLLKKERELS
jgi:hypothetical protein